MVTPSPCQTGHRIISGPLQAGRGEGPWLPREGNLEPATPGDVPPAPRPGKRKAKQSGPTPAKVRLRSGSCRLADT